MSRRAGPILKDVIPPWTYGPMPRGKKYLARVMAARKSTGAQTSVSLDPKSPADFVRSCVPENAKTVVRSVESGVRTKGVNHPKDFRTVELPIPLPGSRRHTLWVNQQGRCYYCTHLTPLERWTIDHMLPRSRGGRKHFSNETGSCWTCNHAKRNLTAEEFLSTEYVRRRRQQSGLDGVSLQLEALYMGEGI